MSRPRALDALRARRSQKVLIVTFEFGPKVLGGLGRVINGLVPQLVQHVAVDVCHLYFDARRLRIAARIYRCSAGEPPKQLAQFGRGYADDCARWVETEGYGVVHFVSVHWIVGKVLSRLRQRVPGQRVVYSVHSLMRLEAGVRRNPESFHQCEGQLLEAASRIHVLNEACLAGLGAAYPQVVQRTPIDVIGNGLQWPARPAADRAFAERLNRDLAPDKPVVVCLSRWAHGKGLEFFVQAAEQVVRAGHDVQFVLAGRKWISWEQHWYRYLLRIEGLARRVGSPLKVYGWLSSGQRNELFSRAQVCVVPSELEYYPYSVLEPAAAGVPLVCSDLPCLQGLLQDGRDCRLFARGDVDQLAAAIVEALCDRPQSAWLASNARRAVSEHCDWRRIARQYAEMYSATLAGGQGQTVGAGRLSRTVKGVVDEDLLRSIAQ